MRHLLCVLIGVFVLGLFGMDESMALGASKNYVYSLNARQIFYLDGVPHTDRQGNQRQTFDAEQSFLPIILYHPRPYLDVAKTLATPFEAIHQAGFNTIQTTGRLTESFLDTLSRHDLQLIKVPARPAEVSEFADHSSILAWEIFDEPEDDGNFAAYPSRFEMFDEFKQQMRQTDPDRPIFVNLTQWIGQPNQVWWAKWQQVGDIACHDNYPYNRSFTDLPFDKGHWCEVNRPSSLSFYFGIPESVGLSLAVTGQSKPLWLIVQAFTDTADGGRWFFPDGPELRAMVYAGIIHGATGINYFTYDNHMPRDAGILGISPDPRVYYNAEHRQASPMELAQIRYLWECTASINLELADSAPWILSPTSMEFFKVYYSGQKISADPIRALLKEHNGVYRLFVVNLDRAPFDIKVEFNRPIKTIERLYEVSQKTLKIHNNAFEDAIIPMGVGVYQIDLSQ